MLAVMSPWVAVTVAPMAVAAALLCTELKTIAPTTATITTPIITIIRPEIWGTRLRQLCEITAMVLLLLVTYAIQKQVGHTRCINVHLDSSTFWATKCLNKT